MSLEIERFFGSKYDFIDKFHNEISIVTDQKGLKGAIDCNGNEVIACQYKEIGPFNKYGLAIAQLASTLGWGIIDKKGNVIVPFEHGPIYSHNYDVYFLVGNAILDAQDCHKIAEGKDSKLDDYVYKFDSKIYDAKSGKFLEGSFIEFETYGNMYFGKTHEGLAIYNQNLEHIDTVPCVEVVRKCDNLILKTRGSIREWEYALINLETGEYVPAEGNVGYSTRQGNEDYEAEVFLYHREGDKKSTIFVNCNNQLITFRDVLTKNIDPIKVSDDRTIYRVKDGYEGIYAEDGEKIVPCEYWSVEIAGNCYIVETYYDYISRYGMFGADGTIKMAPKNKKIKYLGDNIYDVTDEEGKNFLIDENGKLIADFSLPGVKVQGQEIITDSFEKRNAFERRVISEFQAKCLAKMAETKEKSSEEIERLKADYDELNEFFSGTSYLPHKN